MGERRPTYRELAQGLGLSDHKCIADYIGRGMPRGSIAGAKEWYDRTIQGTAQGGAAVAEDGSGKLPGERKLLAEAMCKEADAARKNLDLRKRRNELVERSTVKRAVKKMLAEVRARLESLPDELVASVPPDMRASIANDLRESIALILRRMSEGEFGA